MTPGTREQGGDDRGRGVSFDARKNCVILKKLSVKRFSSVCSRAEEGGRRGRESRKRRKDSRTLDRIRSLRHSSPRRAMRAGTSKRNRLFPGGSASGAELKARSVTVAGSRLKQGS